MCAQMIAGNNRKEIEDDKKLESGRARLFSLLLFFPLIPLLQILGSQLSLSVSLMNKQKSNHNFL